MTDSTMPVAFTSRANLRALSNEDGVYFAVIVAKQTGNMPVPLYTSPAPQIDEAMVERLERIKGEDWENACHELFWETGNIEQFELIQKHAEENANERAALQAAIGGGKP